MADQQIPAGWYPDPAGDTTKIRYWNGQAWTEQVQNAQNQDLRGTTGVPVAPQPVYAPGQEVPSYYGSPAAAPVKDRKGFAIASLVLGIVGIPCGCLAYFAFVPGILAVVFGILGIKSSRKTLAIVGIVLGGIAIIFGFAMTLLGIDAVNNPTKYGLDPNFFK